LDNFHRLSLFSKFDNERSKLENYFITSFIKGQNKQGKYNVLGAIPKRLRFSKVLFGICVRTSFKEMKQRKKEENFTVVFPYFFNLNLNYEKI